MYIALLVTDDKTVVPLCSYKNHQDLIDNYIMKLKTLLIEMTEYNVISVNDFHVPYQFGNRQTVLSDGAYIFKSSDSRYDIYDVDTSILTITNIGYIKILEYSDTFHSLTYIIEKRKDIYLTNNSMICHLLQNNPFGHNITINGDNLTVFTKNRYIKTNCLNPGIYVDKLPSFSKYATNLEIFQLYHNGFTKHLYYIGHVNADELVSDYKTVNVFLTTDNDTRIIVTGNTITELPKTTKTLEKTTINMGLITELKRRIKDKYIEA